MGRLHLLSVEDVDEPILQKRTEHERHTDGHPHVQRSRVRHPRHVDPGTRKKGDDGEYCGDTQCHPGGYGIHADPEGYPGEDDDEVGWDVGVAEVVAKMAMQGELRS